MPYTFGGATTDDIAATGQLAAGADNTATFVAGWWYPTTLTATRGYWSAGNVFGAEVDTTTSEFRLRTDNTTDGQWVTSGAGIAINQWWFLAFLNAAENTTVAGAWRVWVGRADLEPAVITPTVATSRSGNYTGSTAWAIGNKGTGSLAFQGDIGWVVTATCNTVGINNPFRIATSGTISDAEARIVYEHWVWPLWRGVPVADRMVTPGLTASFSLIHWPFDQQLAPAQQWSQSTTPGTPLALTVNGATWTENNPPPVRLPRDWIATRLTGHLG